MFRCGYDGCGSNWFAYSAVVGAKGVGLGRPVLYGNSAWGEDGVRRVVQSKVSHTLQYPPLTTSHPVVIREEVETGMRLLGVTKIEDLKPEMVRFVDRDPAPRS